MWVLCLVLVLLCSTKCPFLFCSHLAEEERDGCFIIFLVSFGCQCTVSLPHDSVHWSAVCGCGISWPYYFNFINKKRKLFSIAP